MTNTLKGHIDQEKDLQNASKRIYTLLLDVRVNIWNIFLHSEWRKKMRKRQFDRAYARVDKDCLEISNLISENRDSHSLNELISRLVELILISRWSHDISIQNHNATISKVIQQRSMAEMWPIWELLILFWMKEDVLESYLTLLRRIK